MEITVRLGPMVVKGESEDFVEGLRVNTRSVSETSR